MRLTQSEKEALKSTVDKDDLRNKPWQDHLEATQFATRVFSELDKHITEDMVLADLKEEHKVFVIEQVKQAFLLRRLIPDTEVAERMFETMIVESIMICLLNRNLNSNTILNIIGNINKETGVGPEMMMEPPMMETPKESLLDRGKKLAGMKK